jgi:hypothetical protein
MQVLGSTPAETWQAVKCVSETATQQVVILDVEDSLKKATLFSMIQLKLVALPSTIGLIVSFVPSERTN